MLNVVDLKLLIPLISPCIILRVHAFLEGYPRDGTVLDQVEWKRFWYQQQRYKTVCLTCLSFEKEQRNKRNVHSSHENSPLSKEIEWGPVFLEGRSKAMMRKWYLVAREKVSSDGNMKHNNIEISDDDEDDTNHAATIDTYIQIEPNASKIASSWLTTARFNILRKGKAV